MRGGNTRLLLINSRKGLSGIVSALKQSGAELGGAAVPPICITWSMMTTCSFWLLPDKISQASCWLCRAGDLRRHWCLHKDGGFCFFRAIFFRDFVRRHISRRAVSSANLPVLREMACMCQWLYWQSSDPIADAQAGKHVSARPKDMLYELGRLCKKLRDVVGWKKSSSHVLWHDNIDEKGLSLLAKVLLLQRCKGSEAA